MARADLVQHFNTGLASGTQDVIDDSDEVLTYVKIVCEQIVTAHINQDTTQIVIWNTEPKGSQRQPATIRG